MIHIKKLFNNFISFRDSYLLQENPSKIYISYYKRKIKQIKCIEYLWKLINK